MSAAHDDTASPVRVTLGLVAGLALALGALLVPLPDLGVEAQRTLAVTLLMATWWLTEAVPISATALVPLVALPLLGIAPITATAAPYANPVIFLFLGGFILACGLEACGLHRRLALSILAAFGTRPAAVIGGFMAATAIISLWINNTATTAMMAPLALSVVALTGRDHAEDRLAVPLLLGVAWSASLGGLGTLVGSTPNALLAGYASETLGRQITFASWLVIGLPLVAVSVPLAWLLLVRLARLDDQPILGGREWIRERRRELGAASRHELTVLVVLAATSLGWISAGWLRTILPGVSDAGIAIAGALALFLLPVGGGRRALAWAETDRLPWAVLVLFGGGLSLAAAIDSTGLATWLGTRLSVLGVLPLWALVAAVTAAVIFLTELTSNTATAATLVPILASVASGLGHDPMVLAMPAAIAASCAFMLPVATPPNAIVFGSGRVPLPAMIRQGLWLNLAMIPIITAVAMLLGSRLAP